MSEQYLYRLSGDIHGGVETSAWQETNINRGNEYPWETKLNPDYTNPTERSE